MIELDINYIVVIVAAFVSFFLGWIWYGPLFGKQWIKLMGFNKKDIGKSNGMVGKMLVGFVAALVMAFVLANVILAFGVNGVVEGIVAGFWMWFGFVATISIGVVLWDGKPMNLFWINSLYWLVSLALMGGILAGWS